MVDIIEEEILLHPADWKGKVDPDNQRILNRKAILDSAKQVGQRRPTKKQQKYLQFLMQGYSKRQAKLKAGYSKSVINTKNIETPAVKSLIMTIKDKFKEQGMGEDYMLNKFKEWFEAEKVAMTKEGPVNLGPDYFNQMQAYDRYRKWLDNDDTENQRKGFFKKKELTLTEFVFDEDLNEE